MTTLLSSTTGVDLQILCILPIQCIYVFRAVVIANTIITITTLTVWSV